MKTSINGIQLIKQFEGFSAVTYFCPANYLTIGYGHVISEKEKQKINRGEHSLAQKEFLKWVYTSGKIMQGLVNRRNAEAILYGG